MRIARETHQSVLAMNDDASATSTASEDPAAMKIARLGRFDENRGVAAADKKSRRGAPTPETPAAARHERRSATSGSRANVARSITPRKCDAVTAIAAGPRRNPGVRAARAARKASAAHRQ